MVAGAALLDEEGRHDGFGEAGLVALGDGGDWIGIGREEVFCVSGKGSDGGVDVGGLV